MERRWAASGGGAFATTGWDLFAARKYHVVAAAMNTAPIAAPRRASRERFFDSGSFPAVVGFGFAETPTRSEYARIGLSMFLSRVGRDR
jgi:hypothetical protein